MRHQSMSCEKLCDSDLRYAPSPPPLNPTHHAVSGPTTGFDVDTKTSHKNQFCQALQQRETRAMAEATVDRLKDEGNKLMADNKPHDAIAKCVLLFPALCSLMCYHLLTSSPWRVRYTEAMNVSGSSHLLLSNRSAAYAKAKLWKEALEDADSCLSLNEKFDKGKVASWFPCCRECAASTNPDCSFSVPAFRLRTQSWCSYGHGKLQRSPQSLQGALIDTKPRIT